MIEEPKKIEEVKNLKCNLQCDVCGRDGALGVASSTTGPVSYAWCRECLEVQTEPEGAFEYLYYFVANKDVEKLHPSFLEVKTVEKENYGKQVAAYITFKEWAEKRAGLPDPDWVKEAGTIP